MIDEMKQRLDDLIFDFGQIAPVKPGQTVKTLAGHLTWPSIYAGS
jgi:hypothetical protein